VPVASVVLFDERILPVPLEASATVWPGTGLPKLSITCTVTADCELPSASTLVAGDAKTEDPALMVDASAIKVALGCAVNVTCVPPGLSVTDAVMVLLSALVDLSVNDATPEPFVTADAGATVLLVPVTARVTVCPETPALAAFFTVTVTVDAAVPFARM